MFFPQKMGNQNEKKLFEEWAGGDLQGILSQKNNFHSLILARSNMFEFITPVTFLLLANSLVTIALILNQNESIKDSITTQTSTSSTNPLEIFTWICLGFQVILLLIKIKVIEF